MTLGSKSWSPSPNLFLLALVGLMSLSASASAQPGFSKAFTPGTIGPGSISTLRFDIVNGQGSPVTNLAFTDVLPAGVTIATPAKASTSCTNGTVSAPSGGTTISLTNGAVAASSTCSVFVDVISSTPGTHMNVSGDLTSSAGNSGPANADLTVATDRPGFTKAFSPNPVSTGSRSTLTFTIDNTLNASQMVNLQFADTLPAGIVVAGPANVVNTCVSGALTGGVVTAVPGTSFIGLSSGGGVAVAVVDAGATCTISVDVIGAGVGLLGNTTGELTSVVGPTTRSSGKAGDVLQVTADPIALVKTFTDDPVPPGGTVSLEFTITNRDRDLAATNLAFTDDLGATLAGLTATGLPAADVCGAGSLLSGAGMISLTGGNLPAQGSCTFSMTLQVPNAAVPGAYPNTTSSITGDVGGAPTVGGAATETLFVASVPLLTKTFLDDPVAAGASTRMEFTITNTSPTSTATDIAFLDELTTILPFPISVTLPATPCNAGSSIAVVFLGVESQALSLTGGNLGAGLSCTFEVLVDIPSEQPAGLLTNTTSVVTATVDGSTVVGNPASDDLQVVVAPVLSKEFTDDPVAPGDTVTLEFTLTSSLGSPADATAIGFTDDLNAALAGLSAVGLPATDVCGAGSQISGITSLTFSGGTLAPGASCTFGVTLQVPAAAPTGIHTNTTSNVDAMVSGLAVTGGPASDDLVVSALAFTKSFTDDPVIPGGTANLQFTLHNGGTLDVTGMSFTDNLGAVLAGATVTGPPLNDICGAGSSLTVSGGALLSFTGGNLLAGASCTFSVTVNVPVATVSDTYLNVTSDLTTSFGTLPPAIDRLVVDDNLLLLTKTFTDDPVAPGATATVEFTLQNLHPTQTATAVGFSDDLGAVLTGLAATGLPASDVCGAGSGLAGTNVISLTGGSLPPGGSCTFSVVLDVPAAAPPGAVLTNTTSSVEGTINGLAVTGDPASDDLVIRTSVEFGKAFDGPTVAGGAPLLTFTLSNPSAASVDGLGFSDDLDAVVAGLVATGLPVSNVCGPGSQLSGTSIVTLVNGNLGPGGACVIQVPLQMPAGAAPGSFPNTTSDLLSFGLSVAPPAVDTLTVEPPPVLGKSFTPGFIAVGSKSTLTFTIDNTASGLAASSSSFTDSLPAGLVVANPANSSTTCGGTVTATPGAGLVTFSGGTVGAGASCTVSVDVTSTAVGTFVNTTSDLASSNGTSAAATAELGVVDVFTMVKAFLVNPVLPGGDIVLEYVIVNPAVEPLTAIAFTDDLDAVVAGLAAVGLPAADVCGAGSQLAGTSVVALTGGGLAAGATCTFQVTLSVPPGAPLGIFPSLSSPVTALVGASPIQTAGAAADLEVAFLTFTKVFDPATTSGGATVMLKFTITNPDGMNAAAGLAFTDDLGAVLPGLAATDLPKMDVCGVGSELSGSTLLTLTGGSLPPGGMCTFETSLQVPGDVPSGTFPNFTSSLEAVVNRAAVSAGAAGVAQADLTVAPPILTEIPTQSGWGLMLLAALLGTAAVWRLRR